MSGETQKRVARRDFLKAGAVLGLTIPSAGAFLAACASSATTAPSVAPSTGASAGASTAPSTAASTAPSVAASVAQISANLFDTMPAETQKYWLSDLYPAFQAKYPGETIVETDGGVENAQMLRALVAANNSASPDMAWMESGEMGVYSDAGLLADVDTWLNGKPDIKKDIYPALISLCTYQGKVQSLPWITNNTACLINTDAFAAAGVAIPDQDPTKTWTWEDFAAACKVITEKSGMKGWLANVNTDGWDAWLFHAWLGAAGGTFISEAGDPLFNGPEGIETMTFLQGLVKAGYTAELDIGYDLTLWRQKKAAIVINGPWNHADLQKTPPDFKYTAVPYPQNKKQATCIGGDNLFVFKHSDDRQKVSFDYAEFVLSTDFQVKFNIESGNLPVTASATAHPDYQAQLEKFPYLKGWVNQVPFGVARSALPQASDGRDAFGSKAWTPIMLKGANIADSLKAAADAVTALKGA